jgi:hypothetical protein
LTCQIHQFSAPRVISTKGLLTAPNGGIARRVDLVTDCELLLPVDESDRFDLGQYTGRASVSAHRGVCPLWSATRPRPGCVDGWPVLVPVTRRRRS